jgi:hypothetical protein
MAILPVICRSICDRRLGDEPRIGARADEKDFFGGAPIMKKAADLAAGGLI